MTNPEIDEYGNKCWYNSERLYHREDGPAIEYNNGTLTWCINGELHRDNGPAVMWTSGAIFWYINDIDITKEVNQWIIDNNFPHYDKWDDNTKILFKLKFG